MWALAVFAISLVGVYAVFRLFKTSPVETSSIDKLQTDLLSEVSKKQKKTRKQVGNKRAPRSPITNDDFGVEAEEPAVVSEHGDLVADNLQLKQADFTTAETEKKSKASKAAMPSKKEIQKNLQSGFVVIQKKGPAPLSSQQKKERDEKRQADEEEAKKQEREYVERQKNREARKMEESTRTTLSAEQIRKNYLESKSKTMSKAVKGGQVKSFTEDITAKQWSTPAGITSGDESPTIVDETMFPRMAGNSSGGDESN